MTLASLEARIAAATGPDREIDAMIELAFPCPMWAAERHLLQLDPSTPGYIRVLTSEPARPAGYRSEMSTASIDAIVALITRSGWHWGVNSVGEAVVYETATRDVPRYAAHCPTPALALCLALVRAEMAKEEAK